MAPRHKRQRRYYENPHREENDDALSLFGSLFDEDEAWQRAGSLALDEDGIPGEALQRFEMPLSVPGEWERATCWYNGVGGLALTFLRAAEQSKDADKKNHFARRALEVAERCLEEEREDSKYVSLMFGAIGHVAVVSCAKLLLGSKDTSLASLISEAEEATRHDENELLLGKAGALAALLWTRQFFWRNGRRIAKELDDVGKRVAAALVASSVDEDALAYVCFGHRFVGAAHGLAGILLVLHWCAVLGWLEDSSATAVRHASLKLCTQTCHLEGKLKKSTIPVLMEEDEARRRRRQDELVHWCHGAAGIPEFARAAKAHADRDGDDALAGAAQKLCSIAADIVWYKGLILKGGGLCHGVAGNAYAFVSAAHLDKNPQRMMARAMAFAVLLEHKGLRDAQKKTVDPERKVVGKPDSPLSLMEGDAGIACFLMDLASSRRTEDDRQQHLAMLGFPGFGDLAPSLQSYK